LDEPKPFANLPRGLAPLGYRDFCLYWLGLATTNTGRWIELTGLVWLVYELTNSPFLVGLLGAARALPALLLSPIAGVIADRLNQRALLVATQALALVGSILLGFLVATERVALWQIYSLVVIQASVNCFDAATRQTFFPRLVPRSVLPRAVTLSITANRVSKFLGPASGGFLIAGLGVASPFFVNAITFVAMIVALLLMRPLSPLVPRNAASFKNDMIEGFRYMISKPVMRGILKLELAFGLFEMNPAMIAIIGREILGVGPEALGLLISAPALGSFVGIVWLLIGRTRRQGRFGLVCMLAYAGVLAALAVSSNYVVSFVALSMIGVLEVLVTVTRSTIMQMAAPGRMRGRVMANMGTITRGVGPLAETQSGLLASAIGSTPAVLTAAGVVGLAATLTALFNRDLWSFSLGEDEPAP
jgi:predicted MFS family arabinose efflux permease